MSTMTSKQAPLVHLEWEAARQQIDRAQHIAVLTHLRPDGDAIGSMLGMTLALRAYAKRATPIVDGGLPSEFAFLPSSTDICAIPEADDFDLILSTDASDLERLGEAGQKLRIERQLPLVQLDHHQTNDLFGDVNLVDARTAAAAEGVYDLMMAFGWEINADIANCLLTGIVTDTIGFRTSNVRPAVLGKSQNLMEVGADLTGIVQRTLVSQPVKEMRFQGEVLNRIQLEDGVLWLTVAPDDFLAAGLDPEGRTGLSGYLIQAEEAMVSALIRQRPSGSVDVSMRAVPGYNVAEVALAFGGGGHIPAAGFEVEGQSLEEVVAALIPRLKEAVKNGRKLYP